MKYFFLFSIFVLSYNHMPAQQVIPLYKDSIPNSIATRDEEKVTNNSLMRITKVSRPTITVYLPPSKLANGTAVIICPGGSYSHLAFEHEGTAVAVELNKVGVAAFLLKYRLPSNATMANKEIGPLQDAQQAIKLVRTRAKEWKINIQKLGIMGFSAGGHLAASAGTHYSKAFIENGDHINLRPDFMILVYPVISFQDSIGHKGSRTNLLDANPTKEKIDYYSNELQVSDSTPPAFLVHATDDKSVKVENSIRFYEALVNHHVPAEMHIYQKGGHGFGMKLPINKDLWLDRCKNWMTTNGWLK